jgi:hypothetical protein
MFHLFLEVCCNHFLSGCYICFTRMLQQYVLNVLVVKSFHVACSKCFIWMIHVFHTHVASACFKCFICFKSYVASVLCCSAGDESGPCGRGTRCARGPADEGTRAGGLGCCRSGRAGGVLVLRRSSWLPSATRAQSRRERRGKVHSWGGAKVDGGRLHRRLDVRALDTPYCEFCLCSCILL